MIEAHSFYFDPKVAPILAEKILANYYDYNCNNYYTSANAVPANYAAAYNLFTKERELVLHSACTPSVIIPTVGNASSKQFIYSIGYYLTNGTWQQFTFKGTPGSTGYIQGTAQAALPRSRLSSSTTNYYAAYVCTDISTTSQPIWRCGCHDAMCFDSYWSLQTFTVR